MMCLWSLLLSVRRARHAPSPILQLKGYLVVTGVVTEDLQVKGPLSPLRGGSETATCKCFIL